MPQALLIDLYQARVQAAQLLRVVLLVRRRAAAPNTVAAATVPVLYVAVILRSCDLISIRQNKLNYVQVHTPYRIIVVPK